MTAKVVIKEGGDTPFLPGELIRLSLIHEVYLGLKNGKTNLQYRTPKFSPLLLSATNSALSKDGFLSSAGFQETKRVLTKAAIEGSSDWLRGLKECIIIGRLIPAGSAFFNYKNYLDNIYLFKNE
jgi:DNA-directed RNA polymerase subunit beta'